MDNEQQKPKLYTDRPGISPDKSPFLFISYSHKSSEKVYADLRAFFDKGLNFWYDSGLKYGDEWDKVVEAQIKKPNCRGVIFFFDINSLSGEAIEKEIKLYEQIKKQDSEKFAFCILDEGQSIYTIICDKFAELKARNLTAAELQINFPEKRLKTVLDAFNDAKIYVPRVGNYIDEITVKIAEMAPGIVRNDKSFVDRVSAYFGADASDVNGVKQLKFGNYPQARYGGSTVKFLDDKIHKMSSGESVLCLRNGKQYLVEPVTWILIGTDTEKGIVKFISKNLIEACTGEFDSISEVLNYLYETVFTERERDIIFGQVSLPSVKDAEDALPYLSTAKISDYVSDKGSSGRAWLKEKENGTRKQLEGLGGNNLHISYGHFNSNGGVMPVIKIDINKLAEEKRW